MYTQVNDEKINLDFNQGIKCTVEGPDNYYYVQVNEFVDGDDFPNYVEGYSVSSKNKKNPTFSLPIEFYMDFEITVSKFISDVGLVKIFSHRFNDYGKYVKFELDTKDNYECNLWVEQIKKYQNKRGCKILLDSEFPDINKNFESYYTTKNIIPYKTYKIGRHPKTSNDFRTTDERCEGLIWFGCWKKFWSYQHPRRWNQISSLEIVNDILGLR